VDVGEEGELDLDVVLDCSIKYKLFRQLHILDILLAQSVASNLVRVDLK